MNEDEAREYTEATMQSLSGGWRHTLLAVRLGVPEALDMTTREWQQSVGGFLSIDIPERR